jgi:hypothetical protein
MPKFIQRTTNTNDSTTASVAIALNATTTVKIQDSNLNRIFFALSNNSSQDVWLKLQAASVDNDKVGIFLPKKSYWEMPTDNIYTGEISAIADIGTPNVYVLEY